MSKSLTDEQFKSALSLSTECAKKKWQHSTDMMMADVIAKSTDKDKTLEMISTAIKASKSEQEMIEKLAKM